MDGGAWWAAVPGVAKSRTRLSDFTFTFHFHALEEEMATHSSVLAWRIPGTGEPGGLRSMGSHRVGRDGCNLAAADWSPLGSSAHGIFQARILEWCHFPGQGILLTQGWNQHLLSMKKTHLTWNGTASSTEGSEKPHKRPCTSARKFDRQGPRMP